MDGRCELSLQDLVVFLGDLHAQGVDLYLHIQGIDTTTPGGKSLFQMMSVFAEFERAMIQERLCAGLAKARAKGKRLGRPKVSPSVESAIQAARAARVPAFTKPISGDFGMLGKRCPEADG
jgi:DNA invertase Pin-like site-specific DNA recombinase